MFCRRWHYQCGDCGHAYDLPGMDLSFSYGTFLGVSRNAEPVILDVLADPAYREVEALVCADPRVDERGSGELGELTRKIVSQVYDRDSRSARFLFDGVPGCPACGSTQVASFRETQDSWPGDVAAARHDTWDAASSDAKSEAVRRTLDRYLDHMG